MITFFILVFALGFAGQFALCLYKDMRTPVCNPYFDELERLFLNSPEENMRIDNLTRRRSLFQTLLSNVAIVLLVLLVYWLCLFFQVL